MHEEERRAKFQERYEQGEVPWDSELPPPEIIELVDRLPPGRALDLGCGYGRTALYLAQQGWTADGVDFVPQAITGARQRAEAAGVSARTRFFVHSVANLDFLTGPYDLAADVGCMHALLETEQSAYRSELLRLLRPGAYYILFARLQDPAAVSDDEEGPRGIAEETIYQLFREGFELERVEHGRTEVEDRDAWRSAWFWFRRS